jgi:hypothetical protein
LHSSTDVQAEVEEVITMEVASVEEAASAEVEEAPAAVAQAEAFIQICR